MCYLQSTVGKMYTSSDATMYAQAKVEQLYMCTCSVSHTECDCINLNAQCTGLSLHFKIAAAATHEIGNS